jgi:hypothetical protein
VENQSKHKHFLDELVANAEDFQSAVDFYDFFEIPMSNELKSAIELFKQKPSVELQNKIKFMLCKDTSMYEQAHDVFKDPVFSEIISECKVVAYEMGFDLDLEKVLSDKE